MAFMDGEHRLPVAAEAHQVGFPVARGLVVDGGGSCGQGAPALDAGGRTALAAALAAAPLGAGEEVAPGAARFRAGGLGVDEAIAGLGGAHRLSGLQPEAAGDLRWVPA